MVHEGYPRPIIALAAECYSFPESWQDDGGRKKTLILQPVFFTLTLYHNVRNACDSEGVGQ